MFSNVEFFIVEAFRSFRRGALMSFVAIATICFALVILGTFLLLVLNLGNMIGEASSKMDIAAYVDQNLSLQDAGALQVKISRLTGVVKVDFISKTEAWRRFQQDFGAKLSLADVVRENPLPHTFAIQVRTPDQLPQVAKQVAAFDEVNDVRYSGKLITQFRSLMDAIRIGGLALVILVSIATLLIVVNTIRLTVIARETDITIMKLVGATNTFVKFPFIIEGVLIGLLGGLGAYLILKISYAAVSLKIAQALPFLPLVSNSFLLFFVYFSMIAGGMALGMLGAYISVSKVLKDEK